METYILILIFILNILVSLFLFFMLRNVQQRLEELENTLLDQHERIKTWLGKMLEKETNQRSVDAEKLEERNQKRYHYMKKELNQILDALDQLNLKVGEMGRASESTLPAGKEKVFEHKKAPTERIIEGEDLGEGMGEAKVPEILSLYHQGKEPVEIAKKLKIPIPQVEMVLQIFAKEVR